jgi:probable phosphoglycerate mutase
VQAASDALRELLPVTDILLLDARHFRSWFGSVDAREIALWGRQQGARCTVVRGGRAFAVAIGSVESFPAREPHGTGADFDAAFLAGIRRGVEPVAAAMRAAGQENPSPRDAAPAKAVAHIDGGSRGNPGVAGAGVYLEREGRPWKGLYFYLGRRTNNFAEYSALLQALRYALDHGVRSLEVFSDSELLVRQLHGRYRVKDATLKELYAQAQELIGKLGKFSIRHVPREENREADALANKAQDEKQSGEETY